jgi:hypothetical protein
MDTRHMFQIAGQEVVRRAASVTVTVRGAPPPSRRAILLE